MKKILLSCACCLLALGLVTACDNEEEEVPNEPESTEPSGNTGDGSGNGGSQNDDGTGNEETIYKLGFLDADNYCYRFFNGASFTTTSSGNTNGPFLSTTTEWDEAVEVVIETTEVGEGVELSEDVSASPCSISFVDPDGLTKYLSYENTYSNTGITFSDEVYTWYWVEDETYSYFCTGDGTGSSDRYIAAYNDSIRAYAMSNLSKNIPASIYTAEPEPVENPNAGLTAVAAETLTNGSQYYVGAVADAELGTYYLFDGGNHSNQQLTGTQVLEDAVLVTATSVESEGWKFTFTLEVDGAGTEYTLYSYMSGTYCEISAAPTSSIEDGSTTTFGWDSTYHGITVTFDSTVYFLAQNRNSSYAYEFQMAAYNSYASTDTWASFYSSVTKAAE